jgi:hypothetical protein
LTSFISCRSRQDSTRPGSSAPSSASTSLAQTQTKPIELQVLGCGAGDNAGDKQPTRHGGGADGEDWRTLAATGRHSSNPRPR